jgi:predicted Zn-dependent protease
MLQLAALRDLQGRYEDAQTLYSEVIKLDEKNAIALNNLAWLTALREGKMQEALTMINKAIAAAGPTPALLDTRGIIYVSLGEHDRAIKDLDYSNARAPAAASYFHLARAYHAAKNRGGAERAMQRAVQAGLRAEKLHALERGEYQRLAAELSPGS